MTYRILLCSISAILASTLVWGLASQPGPSRGPARQEKAFECRWTPTPIKLTGKGTDPAWKNAQTIDNFYVPWLGAKARPARTKTKAKLLWDRDFIYFFADMEDADLYADIKEHNGNLWYNDVFELFFKPADDKPGYYEFQINPAGAVLDVFMPRRNAGGFDRFKNDTKFHVEAKVHLRGTLNKWTDRDDGWSVEGRIPWTDFMRTGGRPDRGEKWKFALCRYDYSVDFEGPELSTCAPLQKANFHAYEDYATLTFVGPEKSKKKAAPAQFIPMTTSRVVGFPDGPAPYQVQRVYPDLKMAYPQITHLIPGTDQLLVVTSPNNGTSTKIYRMKDDPKVNTWDLWFDSGEVVYQLAFHPKFAENGYVFVGSNGNTPTPMTTTPKGQKAGKKKTRLTRYTMQTKAPFKINPASEKVIIEVVSDGHNGAAPVFGPDGMMYLTTGDGTSDSDTDLVGQDMSTLLAKVLRIDVDRPAAPKNYSIPKDNPFINLKGARPEIWAVGLRNPWRSCVDEKTGHIWVGQNGQDMWEQAFLVKKGDNYGWSVMEGSHPFYLTRKLAPVPLTKPTVEHHHSEARSLTGGGVYYGKKYPELVGHYIYGDYSTGKIWAVKHDGAKVVSHREICDSRLTITGFGVDSQGEILIADFQRDKGGLYTFVPTPKEKQTTIFPRKLSESGLFKNVKGHIMQDSLIPYSVNAVLWSDGTAKMRWIGLPKGAQIDYRKSRGWDLPDQTVIVKSFYLDTIEGDPKSRRWIETRFLTRQGTEWYGYSYAWNDAETEGTLVESRGADREFTIKTATGQKKLNWRYPSRSECMVCHSRAANYVLGFSELQFNHVHTYLPSPSGKGANNLLPSPTGRGAGGEGERENQLAVFERLGLFKSFNWASETHDRIRKELKAKGRTTKEINEELAQRTAGPGQRTPKSSSLLPFAPDKINKLVDPYDKTQDLTLRVRSYLHSNCSQCHVEAGGGNSQMELEFTKALTEMRIINVKPVHDTFGLKDAKLVAPGHPERSVLLHRISHRNKGHMPPLATRVVDQQMVDTIREWIRTMK
ncbi:MAG: PQQ-dependent sugar dehydrogenase [Planctomycetes bacterium]|nr:PQQ-dependent sugar dehydrogenase [Planctomycetota bacterium]